MRNSMVNLVLSPFWILALSLFTLLAIGISSQEPGTKTISWIITGDPPGFISQGPDKGLGAFDLVILHLEKNLLGYSFSQKVGNSLRAYQMVKEGGANVGVGFIPSPERKAEVLFSEVFVLGVPAQMIFLDRAKPLFRPYIDDQGYLDLNRTLQDSKIRLGVAVGRSFGPKIDALIQNGKSLGRVEERFTSEDMTLGLYRMLELGRINCTLAYAGQLGFAIQDPKERSSLQAVPLKENENIILPVSLILPKTPWGMDLLEKLNPIIIKFRRTGEYAEIFGRWELDGGAQIMKLMEQRGLR